MTEKLFEQNAYCKEFTAKVLSCEKKEEIYEIILDKTAFFPEGGGQGADKGTLNGVEVLDVQNRGEEIVHTVTQEIPAGTEVTGKLDWDLRFVRMQSHSAEHVVSGTVHAMFGYENVGFHMSERSMAVDFSGPLTAENILEVELAVNQAVWENRSITASFPTREEAQAISYRSKLEITEGLRLVTIDGVDCCACCAPHVGSTGEIGLIKILDFYPNKGGTRVEMIAGKYALEDYMMLNASNKGIMKLLSAKRDEAESSVNRQFDLVNELKAENARLSRRVAIAELKPHEVNGSAYAFCEQLSYDGLTHCANFLLEKGMNVCVLLSDMGEGNFNYVVSSQQTDVRPLVKELNTAFSGKGGGKPNYAQGKIVCDDKETISGFLEKNL